MQISSFLSVTNVKYTRGTFMFLGAQSFPHRNFFEEVCLVKYFGTVGSGGMACVTGASYNWYIYSAFADDVIDDDFTSEVALEMCVTQLDRKQKWRLNPIYTIMTLA